MRTVIGLLSCQQEFARGRRDLCRDTWLNAVSALGYNVFFLVGGDLCGSSSDVLRFDVGDTYPELPQKTHAFCRWALDRGYDRLFKADDDTLIHPQRFQAWLQEVEGQDYVGNEWQPGVHYGSGGAGYLLSRRGIELVADKLQNKHGAEDLLVGQIMHRARIKLKLDPRLIPFGNAERCPLPGNDIVTTHKIPEPLWRSCWAQMNPPST